ncbi:phage tail tape measure protein [Erwinia tracheiphila]
MAINTLAVATKSSAEQAASYVSEMANTYRTAVSDMGNVPFAEMMAGKAAYMAASFGNSLNEIREMVKSAGAAAGGAGVGMNEQLSVLGVLGKSNGAAAGGQYAAFLKNAVAGGRQLGVSLTDAQGKLCHSPIFYRNYRRDLVIPLTVTPAHRRY